MNLITNLERAFVDQGEAVVDNIVIFYELLGYRVARKSLEKILLSITQIDSHISTVDELISFLDEDVSMDDVNIIISYAEQLTDVMGVIKYNEGGCC
jgi:hypothetical protein